MLPNSKECRLFNVTLGLARLPIVNVISRTHATGKQTYEPSRVTSTKADPRMRITVAELI